MRTREVGFQQPVHGAQIARSPVTASQHSKINGSSKNYEGGHYFDILRVANCKTAGRRAQVCTCTSLKNTKK